MTESYDVVVVGARCAGSPLALMLARRGLSVCLLDKASFPSDTPSTHVIQANGVRVLRRLGVAEGLEQATDPLTHATIAFDDARFHSGDVREVLGAPLLSIRRTTLDAHLVAAAAEGGVVVRTGTPVVDLVRDASGRVGGVWTADGTQIRARLVVGADGTRSTVGRLVGAQEYLRTQLERAFQWGYFDGTTAPAHRMWFGRISDAGFLATPTDGGLLMVAVAIDGGLWPQASKDLDGSFARRVRMWPELADALEGAERVGGHHVMARGHGYFRESAGPGWVLVGDAGHFKDPTPGQGIGDALRQVEELAPAIEAALSGSDDQPLREWWRWRDRDAMDMYWLAQQMGAAGCLPPVVREMLTTLLAGDRGIERFALMMDHSLSSAKVLHAGLLARAVGRRWRGHPGERRALLRDVRDLAAGEFRNQWAARRRTPIR